MNKDLDPSVWMPHLWFFLRTVAHTYPDEPNAVTKRKYYDFFHNLPLFIPHTEWEKQFSQILDSFPVTPYLANRDSLFFWIHFIQNRMNRTMNLPESTLMQHMDEYYAEYLPKEIQFSRKFGIQKKYIILGIIICCLCFIAITYTYSL